MINEIRGRIYERYPNQKAFADAIGWSKQKLSLIMSGQREPSFKDVAKMAKTLGFTFEDLARIFLAVEVTK